ncbi:MAG: pyridoxal phosphate-dependent class II aminotransferase [Oscillospiraceae bacterium]|nr:pyridoxal phosphate-dependent class II aminotransferase [Oscillospiraceae bacterium]
MYYQSPNPHGGDVPDNIQYDFSVNTNPLGPSPAALAAARGALEHMDRYPDPRCRGLVRAIAEYEGVPERWVLCGSGAAELIYACCAALRPAAAMELSPTFSEYAAAMELWGGAMERCPLSPEAGFLPDAGFPAAVEGSGARVLFLCSPNNPTGRLLPPETAEALLQTCARRGIRLFVDECFLDLAGGEGMKRHLGAFPGLFILKAFTKTYGMAGLRLGYGLCADEALLEAMARRTPPWNVSSAAQAAGIAALGDREYLERARALIAAERPRLRAALEAAGLRVWPSEANFLLLRGPEALGAALRARGFALRDCANFPGLGPGWYRCAVRTGEENDALARAVSEVL